MDTTDYVALSRQMALMRDMSVIANNVANAGSSGFKAEHTLFETVLEQAGEPGGVAFVQDVGTARDLQPGALTPTGDPLDFAIDGSGWFAFGTPSGTRYSRAGHLAVGPTGEIVDAAGYRLLDDSATPITVPQNEHGITLAADGTLSGRSGPIGRVGLAAFADERALEPTGDGLWRTSQAAQPATGRLVQGMLENSNVQPLQEMTRMIETQRAFDGTQRLIEMHHDLQRKAVDAVIGLHA